MRIPALLLLLLSVTSCEIYQQDRYEEFYVVESYLVAERQLPPLRLSRTGESGEIYLYDDLGINNAQVQIQLLQTGPGSAVEETFSYQFGDIQTTPGVYIPTVNHDVIPERTYRLEITFPNSAELITAETIVPGAFEVLGGVRDSIVYQSSDQLEIQVSQSRYPDRQSIYIFNSISQQPLFENITPLYSELIDEDDLENELERIAKTSSGIINEGNFDINPDNSITVRYPWIAVAFFGDNQIVAHTLDDNVYDFIRSQDVQLGGSTLSPGEIQNVIYNIDGAIGIFGSVSTDTIQTFIKRPDF
ncbi:DUF4249 family protein [Balneola sp. MJW-20]|uniref:DUF4249 family protein n=1 Tax=Gracilimonas aurantiaca TaxID=3234185 RepID=UPI003466EFA9